MSQHTQQQTTPTEPIQVRPRIIGSASAFLREEIDTATADCTIRMNALLPAIKKIMRGAIIAPCSAYKTKEEVADALLDMYRDTKDQRGRHILQRKHALAIGQTYVAGVYTAINEHRYFGRNPIELSKNFPLTDPGEIPPRSKKTVRSQHCNTVFYSFS